MLHSCVGVPGPFPPCDFNQLIATQFEEIRHPDITYATQNALAPMLPDRLERQEQSKWWIEGCHQRFSSLAALPNA